VEHIEIFHGNIVWIVGNILNCVVYWTLQKWNKQSCCCRAQQFQQQQGHAKSDGNKTDKFFRNMKKNFDTLAGNG